MFSYSKHEHVLISLYLFFYFCQYTKYEYVRFLILEIHFSDFFLVFMSFNLVFFIYFSCFLPIFQTNQSINYIIKIFLFCTRDYFFYYRMYVFDFISAPDKLLSRFYKYLPELQSHITRRRALALTESLHAKKDAIHFLRFVDILFYYICCLTYRFLNCFFTHDRHLKSPYMQKMPTESHNVLKYPDAYGTENVLPFSFAVQYGRQSFSIPHEKKHA